MKDKIIIDKKSNGYVKTSYPILFAVEKVYKNDELQALLQEIAFELSGKIGVNVTVTMPVDADKED